MNAHGHFDLWVDNNVILARAKGQWKGTNMKAHGHFDIWVDNDVVLARIKGQWNEEMALIYADHFKKVCSPLLTHNWAHIVYLDDWELGTPELEPIVIDLVTWLIERNLKRTAQVYSPNMLKKFQMDRMVKETFGDFERQVFSKEVDAFTWLQQEGYAVNRQELFPLSA